MRIDIHGRNLPVTAPLRQYAERKLQRVERFLSRESFLDVELSVEKNPRIAESQVAEATLTTRGEVLRARHAATDMYAAIDGLVDRVKRQAMDYHERRQHGRPHHAVDKAAAAAAGDEDVDLEDVEVAGEVGSLADEE
jgi:putative sigma-54 modulation protein